MNVVPYLRDPKTKEPSVSLTLLVLSFMALLVASTFHITGLVENTSGLNELFITTAGLYFGRRIQTKSGNSIETPTNKD